MFELDDRLEAPLRLHRIGRRSPAFQADVEDREMRSVRL